MSGIEPLDDGPSRGGRGAGAEKRGVDGAAAMMAQLALDMVDAVRDERWGGEPVRLRVGLHVGPVVAGVVGSAKPKYTVVGETMNIGESKGRGEVNIGEETRSTCEHIRWLGKPRRENVARIITALCRRGERCATSLSRLAPALSSQRHFVNS